MRPPHPTDPSTRPDGRLPAPPDDEAQPWRSVPIHPGRDLANDELWRISAALARSRRNLARRPPLLPKARRTSVTLLAAAITAAAPAFSLAQPGSAKTARARSGLVAGGALMLGSRGKAVAQVQKALGIPADGIFGPATVRAVRAFQKRAGLTVDGIVGPMTLAALDAGRSARAGILRIGSRGPAVVKLQRALGIATDGIFGKQTRRAVRAFQRSQGLAADGIVGPQTRAALSGGNSPATTSTLQLGDRGPQVAELQRALGIPADGIFGPRTLRAVRLLQRNAGLVADGIVGRQTRAALNSGQSASAENVDPRLGPALALATRMGLTLVSAYRPGATVAATGTVSDHAYSPSKAIDLHGTAAQMREYAQAVTSLPNVETVIFSPIGIWLSGRGWGTIRTSVTYQEHLDHVHVDTF
jgi:peptidoglycan hydrolase-like protein with peptidoglycan-binding domain